MLKIDVVSKAIDVAESPRDRLQSFENAAIPTEGRASRDW